MAADLLISNRSNKTENHIMHDFQQQQQQQTLDLDEQRREQQEEECEEEEGGSSQMSVLAVLVTIFRKSVVGCRVQREKNLEIGWPTDVRHVAHVTFDRFNGFLGLPVEFEPEIPIKPPSASTSVFGVSTQSMQLSYDSRGNSVPTILLLMQQRLYSQGGLQAEGIFRINAENTQEEFVRGHLNAGMVPEGVDPHCLAGLIKAWFRELPTGILDSLLPDDIKQCQSEEECSRLMTLLPLAEQDLLDWAINLMADVVEMESLNKMNARNIAMVFAPNMTQMADPLTALVHAVHVMDFLKSLVTKTLTERKQFVSSSTSDSHADAPDEDEHESSSINCEVNEIIESKENWGTFDDEEEIFYDAYQNDDLQSQEVRRHVYSNEKLCLDHYIPYDSLTCMDSSLDETKAGGAASSLCYKDDFAQNSNPAIGKAKLDELKLAGISNLTRIDSKPDRTESWI